MNINLKNLGVNVLVTVIAVASTFAISQNINKTPKTSSQKNATNSTENIIKDSPQTEEKKSEVNIAEIKKDNTPKLIDYGRDGKQLKTEADVNSLELSEKVKVFLRKEVAEANAWNKEVEEKHNGSGVTFNPKIYKSYGDYIAYFSGYDTGAGPRIWGPALGGEKDQTPDGVVVAKSGEMIGLYGLYTKCSDIIKYKIPYEMFADYKLVGGLDLTVEKCAESERRNLQ